MKNFIRGAIAALVVGSVGAAYAADLPHYKAPPPPPPIDDYQPFQIRLKVGSVIPLDGTATIYDVNGGFNPALAQFGAAGSFGFVTSAIGRSFGPGSVVPGASTSISWSVIPMVDATWYLNKNWAIEAICCITPHHIQGTGVLAGSSLAKTWVFPPSLLLQYHFRNFGAFQPYLGVGVNFTAFWGTRAGNNDWGLTTVPGSFAAATGGIPGALASFYSASITPSWGVVGQAGFDYMITERWGLNLDVKYIMMEPNAHAWIVARTPVGAAGPLLGATYIPVNAAVKINPLVVSAGLTFRFGSGMVNPVLNF